MEAKDIERIIDLGERLSWTRQLSKDEEKIETARIAFVECLSKCEMQSHSICKVVQSCDFDARKFNDEWFDLCVDLKMKLSESHNG